MPRHAKSNLGAVYMYLHHEQTNELWYSQCKPSKIVTPYTLEWSLHKRQPGGCRFKTAQTAFKWESASGDPAAESRSCMHNFFSIR